ncbi:MAG: hypothetical protein ACRDZO_20005 [Egibacteraceae bacterium]
MTEVREPHWLKAWYRRHFLGVETLVVVLVTIALTVWLMRYNGYIDLGPLLEDRRNSLYTVLVGVHVSLLGFVLAITAIVQGQVTSERFALVRNSRHYPTLWLTFTSVVRAFGFATLAAILALLFDREPPDNNTLTMLAVVWTTLLSVFRLARTVWVLERIIEVGAKRE